MMSSGNLFKVEQNYKIYVAVNRDFSDEIINSICNKHIKRRHSNVNFVLNSNLIILPFFPKINNQIS